MGEQINLNNIVVINGRIASEFKESHTSYGETFYLVDIAIERLSGKKDVIPTLISDRLIDVNEDLFGKQISIDGQFRSYNTHIGDGKSKLSLRLFAREVYFFEDEDKTRDINSIILNAYICSEPKFKTTPTGRSIAEFMVAVNRPYGKSDYIPCICWGRNAGFASNLGIGTHVNLFGRIQNRDYTKKFPDKEPERRTVYEVSINSIEVYKDDDSE